MPIGTIVLSNEGQQLGIVTNNGVVSFDGQVLHNCFPLLYPAEVERIIKGEKTDETAERNGVHQ